MQCFSPKTYMLSAYRLSTSSASITFDIDITSFLFVGSIDDDLILDYIGQCAFTGEKTSANQTKLQFFFSIN